MLLVTFTVPRVTTRERGRENAENQFQGRLVWFVSIPCPFRSVPFRLEDRAKDHALRMAGDE